MCKINKIALNTIQKTCVL